MLAMSAWNWRERRPLAPPSRKEDLMGGSNSFLRFLFSSVKQERHKASVVAWAIQTWFFLMLTFSQCCFGSWSKSKWRDKHKPRSMLTFLYSLFDQQWQENLSQITTGLLRSTKALFVSIWFYAAAWTKCSHKTVRGTLSFSLFSYSYDSCVLSLPA